MANFKREIFELIKKTANELPVDVTAALEEARNEENDSGAKIIIGKLLESAGSAKAEQRPICQDTGTPFFYVKYPGKLTQNEIRLAISETLAEATKNIPLRPNAVDVISGKNIGNTPVIHFEETDGDELVIDLLLKGGGSENVSAVYSLPNQELKADRNILGVRKCVLDAVFKSQGKACPPYVLGVALGGNQEEVAGLAKKQLLRNLDDKNPIDELDKLEKKVLAEINELGIGSMGLGGKTTALGIKISGGVRHPASYFVGISISCWALRRQRLVINL